MPQDSHRRIGHEVLDAVGGLPLFATAPLYRRWHLRWGATDHEVQAPMPGDELVPKASMQATRAITIDAPPALVWPWIVQMGYRRAGFYTYDLLDNAGMDSADRILEQYQPPTIGDWIPMAKRINETTAFRVKAFATNEWLLWEKPDSTWTWKLVPLEGGRTRLMARLKQRLRGRSLDWRSSRWSCWSLATCDDAQGPEGHQGARRTVARAALDGRGGRIAEELLTQAGRYGRRGARPPFASAAGRRSG